MYMYKLFKQSHQTEAQKRQGWPDKEGELKEELECQQKVCIQCDI